MAARPYDTAFFGHPRGLSTLFFTEMWERFSFYGMRALLILFMTADQSTGGLGFDALTAGAIYGLYTSMVYMFTLPGGWVADQILGPQRAVLLGGVLIAAGHFSMAVPALAAFYLGLSLIVVGTGLLKGNVSVIVGRLYRPDDQRRDAGYSLFYMGINAGAFLAPFVCGYLGQRVNWHAGFAAAGVGMVFGLVQFALGRKYLGQAGLHPSDPGSPAALSAQQLRAARWVGAAAAVIIAAGFAMYIGILPFSAKEISDAAGVLLLSLSIGFFAWVFLAGGWTKTERNHLLVIGALFLGNATFSAAFEQAGSTLNLFADRNTHNEILGFGFPSSWFQSVNPLVVVAFAPVFAWLWIRLARRGSEPGAPVKFGLALIGVGAGFLLLVPAATLSSDGSLVGPGWLIATYVLHTWAELALSPVGLSAMSKLAPVRISGLVMGVWFLGTSNGNYIGGRLSGFYDSMPLPTLFGAVALFSVLAGALFLIFTRPLKRLSRDTA
jgi:POT family proton-dependent oligopeptide transporter